MERQNLLNKLFEIECRMAIDEANNSNTPIAKLHETKGMIKLAFELNLINQRQLTNLINDINMLLITLEM